MVYCGIDYSITCPCICIYEDTLDLTPRNVKFYYLQKGVSDKEYSRRLSLGSENIFHKRQEGDGCNIYRYKKVAEYFYGIIESSKVDVVVIEDYALAAMGRVFDIAEATGVLKLMLLESGKRLYAIPPKTSKKYFSKNGNSNKENMVAMMKVMHGWDIVSEFGKDNYGSPVSDMVDSYALLYTYFHLSPEDKQKYLMF